MLMSLIIELAHVFGMTYLIPRGWLKTQQIALFVNFVASIIPALKALMLHSILYTPYWGLFYASFWCLTPIFVFLGLIGTFYFPDKNLINIKNTSVYIYILGLVVFLIVFLIVLFLPFTGNFPNPLFNQLSGILPLLMFAWCTTAMCPFALGWAIGCLIQKIKLS